jgi:hypothetical protein
MGQVRKKVTLKNNLDVVACLLGVKTQEDIRQSEQERGGSIVDNMFFIFGSNF